MFGSVGSWNSLGDVQGLHYGWIVEVCDNWVSEGANWEILQFFFISIKLILHECPWGIIASGVRRARGLVLMPAITKDVIDVEVAVPEFIELTGDVFTGWGDWAENAIENTSVARSIHIQIFVNKGVPVRHLEGAGRGIIVPIGNTISNHHTSKIGLEHLRVSSIDLVVMIQLIKQEWYIDTGV